MSKLSLFLGPDVVCHHVNKPKYLFLCHKNMSKPYVSVFYIPGRIQTVPIGYISSCFAVKTGTPRQPTICSSSRASLKIESSVFNNPEHSLVGLEQYSHIWYVENRIAVVYRFSWYSKVLKNCLSRILT